jgi:hypothetical protein
MPDTPAILAVLAARIRALPADNPEFPADALLIAAEAIDAAAAELDTRRASAAFDPLADLATGLRALATRARAQAPVWAEPRPLSACADLLRREPRA